MTFAVIARHARAVGCFDAVPFAWTSVQELKLKGFFLSRKLKLSATGERGPVRMTRKVAFSWFRPVMKNVVQGAQAVAATFAGARSQALPAGGFGQPQQLSQGVAAPGSAYPGGPYPGGAYPDGAYPGGPNAA